jgi:hypothetical protein
MRKSNKKDKPSGKKTETPQNLIALLENAIEMRDNLQKEQRRKKAAELAERVRLEREADEEEERLREELEKARHHDAMWQEVDRILAKNSNYKLLDKREEGAFILCKKVPLSINKSIKNSVFQPYESVEEVEVMVVTLVEWGDIIEEELPIIWNILKKNACPVYKIKVIQSIEGVMGKI